MPVTVSALNFYPVKGLKGIGLEEAKCTELGIEHDRRWMVVDRDGEFLSQREHPKMATVWTEIGDAFLALSAPDVGEVRVPLRPEGGRKLRVQVWGTGCDAVPSSREADQWLTDYLGVQCMLVYMPDDSKRYSNPKFGGADKRVGFADGYAYLLAGEASLADLNAKLMAQGHPAIPMNRFRPNIVVSGAGAFAEDEWHDLKIGDALLRTAKPCGRCQVPSTDQATGEVHGPEPLATLATYREGPFGVQFGMNLVTLRQGTIRVGDPVELT
ncbi:MAG TPA: MOSC N-terminal beta barrel domain-containing protein [Usitatibacter sp.]|nr:MOSC N-terminal beta barrel domain-containing protein [Usitatibacter sp.]